MSGTWILSRTSRAWAFGGVLLVLAATAAKADSVPLGYGVDLAVPSTSAAREPSLNGTVIHDRLVPFTIRNEAGAVVCRGNVQDRVTRSRRTGWLDFSYRIRDTRGSGTILGISMSGFAWQALRIAWRADGLGTEAPTRAYRNPSPGDALIVGGMLLSCAAHQESRFILVRTEATAFEPDGTTTIHSWEGDTRLLDTVAP